MGCLQTICPSGGLQNCSNLSVTGAGSAVDNLYRQSQIRLPFLMMEMELFLIKHQIIVRLLEAEREIPHVLDYISDMQ